MSDYTIVTNFGAKDSLPSGNPSKVIKGSEFTTEYTAVQTAVNSKGNIASPTLTGTVTAADLTITGTLTVDTIDGGTY